MSASRTLAAGHSCEMGLQKVPCDESLPGLGIGMTNEVFQIDGRRQDLRESLQSAVRCSVARGLRFFKWTMLRESWPYALLLIQLLIALVSQLRSGELTVELLAIILGEVWGLQVKVMHSFSTVCFGFPSIPLIVRHNLVLSVL